MTAESEAPKSSPIRVMKWLLGAQIVLAGLLIAIDIGPSIPRLLSPSGAPELDQPIGPGDQTRHYRPNRPATPGPGVDPDMPRRLIAETLEVDGAPALRIRGAVAAGDGDRIVNDVQRVQPARVWLDSPGGSLIEGLKMADLIHQNHVATYVGPNVSCVSS